MIPAVLRMRVSSAGPRERETSHYWTPSLSAVSLTLPLRDSDSWNLARATIDKQHN